MLRYIRLLSYDNACKVIDFVNQLNDTDYANITVGGVCTRVQTKENWDKTEDFIKSLNVRYEIGEEAPYKTHEKIISSLKNK